MTIRDLTCRSLQLHVHSCDIGEVQYPTQASRQAKVLDCDSCPKRLLARERNLCKHCNFRAFSIHSA